MKDRLPGPVGVTITGLVVLVLALLYVSEAAQAAPFCNNYKYLPGYTVQSCKENYRFNTNYWKGRMISKVVSGGNIAKLGWHSWTDTTMAILTGTTRPSGPRRAQIIRFPRHGSATAWTEG